MFRSLCIGGMAAVLLCGVARAAEEGAAEKDKTPDLKIMAPAVKVEQEDALFPSVVLGKYWLGVECGFDDSAALRAQLGLPEGEGIVARGVMPDSPAAKAGLQQHDVLVTAGEKTLKTPQDLIDAIEAAEGKEFTIELFRGGQKKTIAAMPEKRPEHARPAQVPFPGDEAHRAYEKALQWLQQMNSDDVHGPFRFRVIRPGAILPPGSPVHRPLPGNMSISINKQGDQPAKIVVKRDDETWELTEKDLDQLPEDVRPHVEGMLGRMPGGPMGPLHRFDFIPDWTAPRNPMPKIQDYLKQVPDAAFPERMKERMEKRIENRMEEMERRMEQLRKMMEDRWEDHAKPDASEPDKP
ncbi:MAG: hypothetical protein A2V70_17165 [Planctomycetes bacterium RBG_13_63_9]|nr:MAG: hypothetical protein A2V70_17165 [Planctomycetes bacterium RBG_13_63_9]